MNVSTAQELKMSFKPKDFYIILVLFILFVVFSFILLGIEGVKTKSAGLWVLYSLNILLFIGTLILFFTQKFEMVAGILLTIQFIFSIIIFYLIGKKNTLESQIKTIVGKSDTASVKLSEITALLDSGKYFTSRGNGIFITAIIFTVIYFVLGIFATVLGVKLEGIKKFINQ